MVSDSGDDMRLTKLGALLPVPEQADHIIPCPRCDSTNTKFCYYNNYNLSQPRHFCKSCRRYWTQGGTLRDIPVGGGTRKTAKRSRTMTTTTKSTDTAAADDGKCLSLLFPPPQPASPGFPLRVQFGYGGGGDGEVSSHGNLCGSGSFSSLLNPQVVPGGFLALNGFGLGFEDMGYGFGRGGWSFSSVIGEGAGVGAGSGGGSDGSGGGHDGVMIGMGDTWQVDNGSNHNGFVGGDCFS